VQAKALANLGLLAAQPNKVWSAVHFLMHNQPTPMSSLQVQASQALASFLLERFWCDDCRGFFYTAVILEYGLPPNANNPDDHAKWWWQAHNAASEHVASIRGGHPWIHQDGAAEVAKFQNPYFMPWEDAVAQWKAQP